MTLTKKKRGSSGAPRRVMLPDDQNDSAALGPGSDAELPATDVLPPDIIRSEVNFLALPFFALSRRDTHGRMKTEYHTTVQRGDERLEVSWKVLAHQEYGYPGPFDREVHKAIEHMVSEMRPPLVGVEHLGLSLAHSASSKASTQKSAYHGSSDSLQATTDSGLYQSMMATR